MKRLHKILLFIISFIGLGFSFGVLSFFYNIPVVTDMLKQYYAIFPWLNNFLLGYCIFICLCFLLILLIALFSPSKSSELILLKSKGKLCFSKQTIESTAHYSFANIDGINNSKVKAKINKRPEKTKIYVKLSLNDSSKLVELTETIQEKIESSLKLSLGIPIESVNVKVVEFNQGQKSQKEIDIETAKSNRVI